MQKIKIAQIGMGHDHAPVVFDALQRLPEIFEVVGYAQVPEDGGAIDAKFYEGARQYDVREILAMPDLDAIAVETFDLFLARYALLAAQKGVHVHMDKACGEDIETYERMLSVVKQKGTVFHTGYIYRVNPAVQSVFARAQSCGFGKIFAVNAEMSCRHAFPKRQWLGKLQGGMMQYLGCHMVYLVVRLLGVPEEIVPYNYCTGVEGVTATDAAFAVFRYPRALATVQSCIADEGGFVRRSFTVHGEKGTAEIRPMEINIDYPAHIVAHDRVCRHGRLERRGQNLRQRNVRPLCRHDERLCRYDRGKAQANGFARNGSASRVMPFSCLRNTVRF